MKANPKTQLIILTTVMTFLYLNVGGMGALWCNIQSSENEKLLCKKWVLLSASTCDRCPNFVPKDTLLASFYSDHSCNGMLLYRDSSIYGTWELANNKLTIRYKNSKGEPSELIYFIRKLTDVELRLGYQTYYGSAEKKFAALN